MRRPSAPLRSRVEHLEDRITPIAGDLLQALANPALAEQFGISVATNGTYAVVGAPFDDPGGVTDAGSAYVFNLATGALVTTLSNPDPDPGDRFGFSLAVAPGSDIIWVGAPFDDPNGVTDSGTLYAFWTSGGGAVTFLNNPSPAAGDQFGYSLATERFGSYLAIGAPGDDSGAADAGRAYLAFYSGGGILAHGTASNPDPTAGDRFGQAVAVTQFGDLFVGAPFDDPNGVTDAGAAYVYNADYGAIMATLANPDPAAGDQFGSAISLGGNSFLAVIGAPFDDPDGVPDAGSAYVFDANFFGETPVTLVGTLNNPDPAAGDQFGASVSISNLVAVVGAPFDDPGGVADAGSAYEFRAPTGELLATLNNLTPTTGDRFGVLAQFGERAVVLAPFDDATATDAGSAYVFDLNNPPVARNDTAVVPMNGGPTAVVTVGNDTWFPDTGETLSVSAVTQGTSGGTVAIAPGGGSVTYTPPANFTGTDTFTYTVSDGKDGTAVGTVTVDVRNAPSPGPLATVVGPAPEYYGFQTAPAVAVSGNRMAAGSFPGGPVGVFDTDTGALLASLSNPADGSYTFGSAVAMSGNLVVVGDWSANRAYLFDATTGALLRTFTPAANPSNPWFGFAVAIDGNTVAVGAYEGNEALGTGPNRPGRVYLFDAATGALIRTVVNPTPGFAEESFGTALAISGDTLVVGAYRDQPAGNLALGQVYVYDIPTGALLLTLNDPTLGSHNLFGTSVGISGNRIVVGAREVAYLFDATTGERVAVLGDPTQTLTFIERTPVTGWFGTAVAISGDRVLVGAFLDDTGATDAGAAYLFDAATGAFLRTVANPTPAANDQFGFAVAISGDRMVVAAWRDEQGGATGAGTAFSFAVNFPPTPRDDAASVPEDNGPTVINVLANDTATPDAGETLTVTTVTQPASGTVTLTDGVVRYTPSANFNGTTSFTYTVADGNGGSATATATITVTPVNDAPLFTRGANQTVRAGSGPRAVSGWATNISPGPADEADQGLTFVVTTTNPGLFVALPTIDPATGMLTFIPEASVSGTATVTLVLRDTGGRANGGVDVSAARTFTITVNPNGLPATPGVRMAGSELVITGANTADTVSVSPQENTVRVNATLNGVRFNRTFSGVTRVRVDAKGGNDTITFANKLNVATWTSAGAGNDTVIGGGGADEVYLGAGDDTAAGRAGNDLVAGGAGRDLIQDAIGNDALYGGDGNDFVIGGPGVDQLFGQGGHDILVGAMVTVRNTNTDSLRKVLTDWNPAATGIGGYTNIRSRLVVTDDGSADRLRGEAWTDWFWAFTPPDTIDDLEPGESQN